LASTFVLQKRMVAALRGGRSAAALPSFQLIHGLLVARAPDMSGANNSDPGGQRIDAAAMTPPAAAPTPVDSVDRSDDRGDEAPFNEAAS